MVENIVTSIISFFLVYLLMYFSLEWIFLVNQTEQDVATKIIIGAMFVYVYIAILPIIISMLIASFVKPFFRLFRKRSDILNA